MGLKIHKLYPLQYSAHRGASGEGSFTQPCQAGMALGKSSLDPGDQISNTHRAFASGSLQKTDGAGKIFFQPPRRTDLIRGYFILVVRCMHESSPMCSRRKRFLIPSAFTIFEAPNVPSDALSSVKQVLPGRKAPRDQEVSTIPLTRFKDLVDPGKTRVGVSP